VVYEGLRSHNDEDHRVILTRFLAELEREDSGGRIDHGLGGLAAQAPGGSRHGSVAGDGVGFVQALMGAEADALCGAPLGQRSADRVNQRNGYRERRLDTRVGTLELAIPKLRQGGYFPEWLLELRRRGERALVAVVAECYVRGVSTRRVEGLVQTLGITSLSKSQVSELAKTLDSKVAAFRTRPLDAGPYAYVWVDALAVKCREAGRIVNVACVVATGVNADGHREILGVDVLTSEDGAGWTAFLRDLVARGLGGVELVISDAHQGLKQAIAAVLPGASWQRCRTH
jgi:putative transposase